MHRFTHLLCQLDAPSVLEAYNSPSPSTLLPPLHPSTLHTHGVISPFTPQPFPPLSPRCLTKKAALTVSSPLVDYGPGVILAESASRTFTISNGGALDVEYAISLEDPVRL